jgi:VWFA-related protein
MALTMGGDRARGLSRSAVIAALLAIPGAAAALDPPATGTASPCRVSLIEPREGEILYGMVDLSAEAVCPDSTAPDRVQFLADGELVAEATRTPYRAVWEAGGTFRKHLIQARLIDREGRVAQDVRATPGSIFGESVRVISTPIDRVDLSVSVTDRVGRHVPGLSLDDFIVEEAGREQRLQVARPEHRPLSLAVLIDVSGSMERYWSRLLHATPALARTLGPEDAAKVIAFSGPAFLVQDFTRDAVRVAESMGSFERWGGGTSLYDSLAAVGTELAWTRAGRQAIVMITDGLDTLSRIDPPRLRDYLRRTDVTLEAFLVETPESAVHPRSKKIRKQLERVCLDTGGSLRPIDLDDIDGMEEMFRRVGRGLQDRYYLSYQSDRAARKGGWREIEIRTRNPTYTVRTRRGVIANRNIGDYLLDDLRDGNTAARRKAAEWLGRLRVPGSSDLLLEALGDRSPEVRAAAALALGRLREPRAIEPLVQLLYSSYDSVGRSAAEGLRTFGPAAVPTLIEALGRPRARGRAGTLEEEACVKAIDVLADIGDARAVDTIAGLARPPRPASKSEDGTIHTRTTRQKRSDTRIRAWALWALGRMGRPDTLPIMEQGIRDRDPDIRLAAVWALGESGLPRAIPILEKAAAVPDQQEEVLEAIATVLAELRSPTPEEADPE